MAYKKQTQKKEESVTKPAPPPKKPVLPQFSTRPPLTSSFSIGSKIRQDGKGRFFARTRRGGI